MKTSSHTSGLWLCLYFHQLPLEIFSRSRYENSPNKNSPHENSQHGISQPQDDIKPVVVLARQRVAYMNAAAREMGIRTGSSMNTAYTISEQVISFEQDEAKEVATLAHLAQWAYQFTPNVSIKSPHNLLLDISGCLKLFHGLDNLKKEISGKLEKLGFQVAIGVNGTPMSALCFAESGAGVNTGDRDIARSLNPIPIGFLRIDDTIKDALQQMGISTVRQLLELPIDGLNRRFGVFFTDYLQRLVGEKPDPQKFVGDKPRFRSEVTFLADVTNIESLVFPMKRLLAELQDFLRGRQLLINQFGFKLSHRSHPPRVFNIYLANPENDAQMFLMLSQLQIEKVDDMPEVDNISLSANTFFDAESGSGDLFHGTFNDKRFKQKDGRLHSQAEQARAARLLNMIGARLGPGACFGLSLANDHRPEHAWKPVTMTNKAYWQPAQPEPNARPFYLLSSPKALGSINNQPCLAGQLELLHGPERIDFGWWDNQNISRDYYVGRHECGALYWVFLDRGEKKNDTIKNNAEKSVLEKSVPEKNVPEKIGKDQHRENWYLHGIFS